MRRFAFFGLLVAGIGIGVGANEITAQTGKTDPKTEPKGKLENKEEKKYEWPKKIQNKTLEQWVAEMRSARDPSQRDLAIRTIPSFGPDCRKVASKNLIAVLNTDPDINVKLTALATAYMIGFDDGDLNAGLDAIVAYIKPGSTASNHTRYEATMAIGNCGPIAKRAIQPLTEWTLIDKSSWQNRKAAAFALGRLGMSQQLPPDPMAKKDDPPRMTGPDLLAMRALCKALKEDFSHQVRREVVQSLMLLGQPQSPIVWKELRDALTIGIKDTDLYVQIWSRVCFIRTEQQLIKPGDPNLEAIAKLVNHEELPIRLEAIQALGVIGDEASSKVSLLISMATDPKLATLDEEKDGKPVNSEEFAVAAISIWALGQMKSEINRLVPLLNELQKSEKKTIKYAAKDAYKMLTRADDPKFEAPKKDIKKP